MADPKLILSLYVAGASILALMGLPLQRGWLPPNRWYGFRTSETLADRNLWYAVNKVTGFWLIATGLAVACVAVVTYYLEIDVMQQVYCSAATYILGLVIMVIRSLKRMKQG